jgi:hypothetical protein
VAAVPWTRPSFRPEINERAHGIGLALQLAQRGGAAVNLTQMREEEIGDVSQRSLRSSSGASGVWGPWGHGAPRESPGPDHSGVHPRGSYAPTLRSARFEPNVPVESYARWVVAGVWTIASVLVATLVYAAAADLPLR